MAERESFKSRLGFLLVSAGCAIGIGNVWKFPWLCGQNGGGIFVLFYLLFLVIMGIPVMSMEFAVGRASRKSTVEGFKALEKEGSKWHLHGYASLVGNYFLMFYYTGVSGWMLNYTIKFLTGKFSAGMSADAVTGVFNSMLGNPGEMLLFMALTVIIGMGIVGGGVQKGVENVTKFLMIGLFALILVLAARGLSLSGAKEGLKFYLVPDMGQVREVGLFKVITNAMCQALFTLSLGICSMEIFGTYIGKKHTIGKEALRITVLDTFIAIMAGLIIFPACFTYNGGQTTAGPPLIFITLPNIFVNMGGGRFWGTLFFVFMTFASMSTVVAVFENIVASGMDTFRWTRKKSVIFNLFFIMLFSIPACLGYNVLSSVHPLPHMDFLDSEDFIVSYLLLPIGSIMFILFCTSDKGWGWDNFLKEANEGEGFKYSPKLKPVFKFILPVIFIIILIVSVWTNGIQVWRS